MMFTSIAALLVVGVAVLAVHLWEHGAETVFFGDIRGIDVAPAWGYERLIQSMGQPNDRSIQDDMRVLYYDGVTFYVTDHWGIIRHFDITGEQFTLGGRNRIGVGSTRAEVEADYWQRRANPFQDCSCSRIRRWSEPSSLENAGFWYSQHFTVVEFEFDENNIVIRMRISSYG